MPKKPSTSNQATPFDMASRHLLSYTTMMWQDYIIARHHVAIAQCLEAVALGKLKRLLISIQPRAGKTMLTGENFIPFYFGRHPNHQVIYATASYESAGELGRKVRNQMRDPIYQQVFPGVALSQDSQSANKFATNQKGIFIGAGVNSSIIGKGAHLMIIDDPYKGRREVDSATIRAQVENWYKGVAYMRLMPHGAIVVIHTRWRYDDLIGWLLEKHSHEKWFELRIPTIAEDDDDPLGRAPGEYLWPDYFKPELVENIKKTGDVREWNAQFQQRPLPEEGGMISEKWFRRYDYTMVEPLLKTIMGRTGLRFKSLPYNFTGFAISWDTAFKEQEMNDPSAATLWGINKDGYYWLYTFNKHLEYPFLKKKVVELWHNVSHASGKTCTVLIEDKASGQSLIQDLRLECKRMPVVKIQPEGNKAFRLSEVTNFVEAGQVYIPEHAPWLNESLTQLLRFPAYRFDDIVDSFSQFLRWVNRPRFVNRKGILFWK